MAISSFPFENADTTEVQYSRMMRLFQTPGVVEGLQVSANSSGMQVFVGSGMAHARGYNLLSTAQETRSVTPAGTGLRTDAIVARIDPTANTADFVVIAGPGGTSLPTLQRTEDDKYDVLLASIAVRGGTATIAATDITDRRAWVGSIVHRWSSSTERPAATTVRPGTIGYDAARDVHQTSNGSAWRDLIPAIGITDVAGLTAALGAKAAIAHTHTGEAITSGTININRLPPLPASAIVTGVLNPARLPPTRAWHTRTPGVTVGLGGTTRTVTFPAGWYAVPPVVQISLGNQTQASNLSRPAIGSVTKDSMTYTIRNEGSTAQDCTVYLSVFPES